MDQPITTKTSNTRHLKYFFASIGLFSLAGAYVYASNISNDSKSYNVDINSLVINQVSHEKFSEYVPIRGIVEPEDTIFIDAIDGGRVEQVYIREGAIVEKGQPILKLSNTNLQLNVLAREAEVSEQINNMRNTRLALEQNQLTLKRDVIQLDYEVLRLEKEFKRNKQLVKQNLISAKTFEQVQDELQFQLKYRETVKQSQEKEALLHSQQLEQLAQSIKTLETNLAISRSSLDNLIVRAPVSGQLTFLDAKVGESKSSGQRIGQVDLINQYKISALVDEFYVNSVHKDQKASFNFSDNEYQLSINKIYPGINQGSFKIDFVLDTPQIMSSLRLGQSLQLKFNLSHSETKLQIANGGFFQHTGGNWVFKLSDDGSIATKLSIKTGKKNPQSVEVLSGLSVGDKIITSSYASFLDADRLIISNKS